MIRFYILFLSVCFKGVFRNKSGPTMLQKHYFPWHTCSGADCAELYRKCKEALIPLFVWKPFYSHCVERPRSAPVVPLQPKHSTVNTHAASYTHMFTCTKYLNQIKKSRDENDESAVYMDAKSNNPVMTCVDLCNSPKIRCARFCKLYFGSTVLCNQTTGSEMDHVSALQERAWGHTAWGELYLKQEVLIRLSE